METAHELTDEAIALIREWIGDDPQELDPLPTQLDLDDADVVGFTPEDVAAFKERLGEDLCVYCCTDKNVHGDNGHCDDCHDLGRCQ